MDPVLDLHDIQGNIIKAYPRFGYSWSRHFFFRISDGDAGRAFLSALIPSVTTAAPWTSGGSSVIDSKRPKITTNIAFTFEGLKRLGVPQASLQTFPEEFAMGMTARRDILGDDGPSAPATWDPIWQSPDPVHIFISINASSQAELEFRYREVLSLLPKSGVDLAPGHRSPRGSGDLPYQDSSAIFVDGEATAREHFGYTDGISNPYFKGAGTDASNVIGGGKATGKEARGAAGWAPLETGEFLLGHKDEAFEYPVAPIPNLLGDNGTYLVYRKLHQNVGSFDAYLAHEGALFPGGSEALAAKFVGRWRNGAPVTTFPTEEKANEFAAQWAAAKLAIATAKTQPEREAAKRRFSVLNARFVGFDYTEDIEGTRCPASAHTRRANPRSALEFGVKGAFSRPSALSDRRRILRRGLPYGDSQTERNDAGEHGIIFMALCASIRRQFEFVQQQWLNYGNDFRLGNDKDPLLGNQDLDEAGQSDGRMVIESDPSSPAPPFLCAKIPRFVETRGGDYFFVPSLTALRMIAHGIVDPT
ncbi:MAG: Dyp-type peroxidase [Polyangiaceae bacterium]